MIHIYLSILNQIGWMINPDPSKRPDVFTVCKRVADELGLSVDIKRPVAKSEKLPSPKVPIKPPTPVKRGPAPSAPTQSSTPKKNQQQGGANLFDMLDWEETNNQTEPINEAFSQQTAFEDEGWTADFSEADFGDFEQQQTSFPKVHATPQKEILPKTPVRQTKLMPPPQSVTKTPISKPALERMRSADFQSAKQTSSNLFTQQQTPPVSRVHRTSSNGEISLEGLQIEENRTHTRTPSALAKFAKHVRSRSDLGVKESISLALDNQDNQSLVCACNCCAIL